MRTLPKIIRSAMLAVFAFALSLIFVSELAFAESSSIPVSTQQDILDRLTSMGDEIKALRSEVSQLRQAVTEIHRSTVRPGGGQAPAPATVDVLLGDAPMLGDAEATVGIVEFTDYQCPFCKRYHEQTFIALKEQYIDTGKVRYFLRDFPLNFHKQAKGAAVAAHCTGSRDGYWTMSHELFVNQRRLGPELYKELATTLQLNEEDFLACLQDPAKSKAVEEDLAYGQSVSVRGTPNFFIGHIQDGMLVKASRISGAQPLSTFSRVIDPLLR